MELTKLIELIFEKIDKFTPLIKFIIKTSVSEFFKNAFPILTAIGILVGIFIPIIQRGAAKRKNINLWRKSIFLYFGVLGKKTNNMIKKEKKFQNKNISSDTPFERRDMMYYKQGFYEKITKENHDAIEEIYLEADDLPKDDREKLFNYLNFMKIYNEIYKLIHLINYRNHIDEVYSWFKRYQG